MTALGVGSGAPVPRLASLLPHLPLWLQGTDGLSREGAVGGAVGGVSRRGSEFLSAVFQKEANVGLVHEEGPEL